jgi:hypothetical protein
MWWLPRYEREAQSSGGEFEAKLSSGTLEGLITDSFLVV